MKARLFVFLFLFLAVASVSAQEFRATLTGRVVDASGGAVPSATLSVTNTATNDVRTTTTDGQGNYTVPLLTPGNYKITVEAAGFKKTVRDNVPLQMSQTATVNLALEVGNITESVSVTAEAPLLDTVKADRGGVIDTQRIHELPINGRNPFLLGAMIAGVNFHGAAIWQRPFDNGAIAEWTINGGQQRGTEFLLDGAPNNSQMGGNNIAYVPPVDSVQEFKINTNSYDAQYGHTNGGIVNVTTKGGTNQIHGSAYGFFKRTDWNANLFQNNAKAQPRPQDTLDWWGVQAAGPVYVPKIFDGRNKLFFMTNYENYAEEWPQKLNLSVPAPEFLQGDFSKLVDKDGRQIKIYDPLTATTANPTRTQFAGNRIPANRLSPIAQKILTYYGAANTADAGKSYSESNYVNGTNFATDSFYNLVFKFDTNLGDKDRFFLRHASNDRTEHRNENGSFNQAECCQLPFQRINDHVTADWVRTMSARLVLNVRASYNRFIEKGTSFEGETFDPATLGWPSSFVSQLPNSASVKYFPKIELRGAFNYADLGRYPGGNITNTYAIHPNATWILGAHSLKFGLDYRFTQFSTQDVGNILRLRSTRRWTRERWDQDDPLSGNPVADFMLGMLDEGEVAWRQLPIYGAKYIAPYLQDDWKVTRRLNLNLGLRWDINAPPKERFTRGNYIFDPNGTPTYAGQIDTTNLLAKQIKGGLTFLGAGGNPVYPAKTDWNNFQPRFGMAYQVKDKIIARAGWGIYYVNPNDNWHNGDVRQGFDLTTPVVRSTDGDRTPISNMLGSPFPGGVLQPQGANGGLNTFLNRDITYFDPNFRVPYVHQFSAGFQFELPYSSVVEVSYVGNRTVDLQSEWDGYNAPSAAFRKLCNPLEGGDPNYCNQTVPNPFKGVEAFRGTGLFTANTISRYQANRPFPQFNRIRQRGINPGAIYYNSMQVQHQTRFRGGINLLTTYTLSKQIENWGYTDNINKITQQGLYFQDRPHRFTLAGIWKLPFGRGHKLGGGVGPVVDRFISGWEITSFLQIQSGRPWDLPSNMAILKDPKMNIDNWLAYRVQGASPCVWRYDNSTRVFAKQSYASSCTEPVFLNAPNYTEGRLTPSRSGQIRLHTSPNLDASVNKTVRIKEGVSVQFRAEAFNVTNTYFWGRENFINDPANQNFGAYFPKDASDQNRYPRQIQLALKLLW